MKKTMHDMSPSEIAAGLKKAKALIDHPDKWVQHAFTDGTRICAHRAMEKTAKGPNTPLMRAMLIKFIGRVVPGDNELLIRTQTMVCQINNLSTHDRLMARFDRAIAKQQRLSGG